MTVINLQLIVNCGKEGKREKLTKRQHYLITFVHLTYTQTYIRGAFNKFPDFFVQVFKTVVGSWKFSMLLLYILWDDWPIFMISASNEQLQQELEYTLLKPDCHSWWISKMQSCMNRASVFDWHKRLRKAGSLWGMMGCERSKEVNTPEFIGQRVRVRVTMLRF